LCICVGGALLIAFHTKVRSPEQQKEHEAQVAKSKAEAKERKAAVKAYKKLNKSRHTNPVVGTRGPPPTKPPKRKGDPSP